jgi:hypothetical protein
LLNKKHDDPELVSARKDSVTKGTVGEILSKMNAKGYWVKPGAGYGPKYKGSVWTLITLAQCGVTINDDPRIKTACKYYLDNAFCEGGYLGYNGTPSATIDCLQGNMCAALLDLECKDSRVDEALDWLARSVTGEGVAPITDKKAKLRYYAYKCGPLFACGVNGKKPCAWGAVKVMLALSKVPKNKRTKYIDDAIKTGSEFLLSSDISSADYPTRDNFPPNRSWFKLGFPVFYVTDVLQNVEALINLGYGKHPNVKKAVQLILDKQDGQGRWPLDYHYNGKTWTDWGQGGKPSKWVTYRVYNTLRKV